MKLTLVALLIGCQGEEVKANSSDASSSDVASDVSSSDVASDGAPDVSSDTPTTGGTCPGYRVGTTDMVKIDSFCIDVTEVTHGQWKTFAAAADRKTFVPSHCDWNKTDPPIDPSSAKDDWPRDNVNFCDAKTYCAWAGKRLCGKIGGGSTPKADFADPAKDQWQRACSNGGKTKYPYGDAYDATKCATGMINVTRIKSFPECHGVDAPYKDILDMSGNAEEWEDACETPAPASSTLCNERGGETGDGSKASCANFHDGQADARFDALGFRCCKDI